MNLFILNNPPHFIIGPGQLECRQISNNRNDNKNQNNMCKVRGYVMTFTDSLFRKRVNLAKKK